MPNTIRGDPVDNLVDIVQTCQNLHSGGAERGSCDALCKRLQPLFEKVETDALGNILCLARKGKAGEKRLMLEAHIDEVALVVSEVDDEGFVRVTSPYGMDIRSVASKVMTVHGRRPVLGVMSSVPPHLKSAAKDSEPLEWDGFVLDVGLDAQKARTLICPGDRVTFSGEPALLMDGRITGRALDNRAGAAVLRAVQLLKGRPSPVSCGRFDVQEEASTTRSDGRLCHKPRYRRRRRCELRAHAGRGGARGRGPFRRAHAGHGAHPDRELSGCAAPQRNAVSASSRRS